MPPASPIRAELTALRPNAPHRRPDCRPRRPSGRPRQPARLGARQPSTPSSKAINSCDAASTPSPPAEKGPSRIMGQVSIVLNGRTYRLNCGDGEEERLAALATYVKEKFDALTKDASGAVNEQLLLMTALVIADELFDAVGQTSRPPSPSATPPIKPAHFGPAHHCHLATPPKHPILIVQGCEVRHQ